MSDKKQNEYSLFEDSFINKLWTKSLLSRAVYISIPFIIIGIFIVILHNRGAFGSEIEYNFLEDYANSYHLFCIFLFNYFMRGSFINYYKKKLNQVRNKCSSDNRFVFCGIYIFSYIVSHFSLFFTRSARQYNEKVWVNHLSSFETILYRK